MDSELRPAGQAHVPADTPVALVNMPFATIRHPSIQIGLLQAHGCRADIPLRSLYANLDFAARIGFQLHEALAIHRGALIGEWLFTKAAFPEHEAADEFPRRYGNIVDEVADVAGVPRADVVAIRDVHAPAFVAEMADRLVEAGTRVVGFTSTFEQNVASLALARAVKERDPAIATVFGGANYDADMGRAYLDAYPWIDIAVAGEADDIFVPLIQALLDGAAIPELIGVNTRTSNGNGTRGTYRGSMDALPVPNYDDYFEAIRRNGFHQEEIKWSLALPFESSRGCWWGAKHHCTFCGLNGMAWRAKSVETVVSDISTLATKYHVSSFLAVDNIIGVDMLRGLVSQMTEEEYDYDFFYEIKANLTRAQIRGMRDAGILRVQPGIESLSSPVLSLMRKGITGIQNINTLRWLRFYGVQAIWNILFGFPGEAQEDYDRQLEVIELTPHLRPPKGAGRIWLERFGPYFKEAEAFGFDNLRPDECYSYIYPPPLSLHDAAYFFQSDPTQTLTDDVYAPTQRAVERWQEMWRQPKRPYLLVTKTHPGIRVIDGRSNQQDPTTRFYKEPLSHVYLYCSDRPRGMRSILEFASEKRLESSDIEGDVQDVLQTWVRDGVMIEEDGRYLSLALPRMPWR